MAFIPSQVKKNQPVCTGSSLTPIDYFFAFSLCSLQVHMIRKHYKEKPFPCSECDQKFYTITDMQKHVKIKHLNEKPFACEKCGKQYSTSGGLLIHNRSAHGDQGEWLQCEQCDKKFAYKQILQAHVLNNHDKGNFMCEY